jgi:thiol-disulfide isomerase/thioredoxin
MTRPIRLPLPLPQPLPRTLAALFGTTLLGALLATGAVSALVAGPASAQAPLAGEMKKFALVATPEALPEFDLTDADGKALTLSNYAGKLVLVNLWATWCGPCVKEMPTLDALQQEMGSNRFTVLPISLDRGGRRQVEAFFAKNGINHLPMVFDPTGSAMAALTVRGLPTTLLLDGHGRELGRLEGDADWANPATKALIQYYLDAGADGAS